MAHIGSIGAGMFSAMAVNTTAIANISAAPTTEAGFKALFATTPMFAPLRNVREFPAMGTPANIVNVPVYGQKTTQQIQGQADAPSMELQLNYVASEWDPATDLGGMVGDGKLYAIQFALLNAEPADLTATLAGLGTVENSVFYFVGKLEALLVTPSLTDANTATVTITVQSAFYGPFTN